MKIILSRKGVDSASGGAPSPIFPDGSLLSIPIPDADAPLAYQEIAGCKWADMGEFVAQLACRPATHRAHLDPDLRYESLPRAAGWRPLFGQAAAAEGHLRNCGVGAGDIFLYFGLFQQVEKSGGTWRYVKGSRKLHVIFGWLQIAIRCPVSAWPPLDTWAKAHPYYGRTGPANDTLYVAADHLTIPNLTGTDVAGAGTFPFLTEGLTLTAPDSTRPGTWRLPSWFHPEDRKSALSYHGKTGRWERQDDAAKLSSASRGQEFVLDCDHYPEASPWLLDVLAEAGAHHDGVV